MQLDAEDPRQNQLLAALSPTDYQLLRQHAEIVQLSLKQELATTGNPMSHVYFPLSAVVSCVGTFGDGSIVEIATVGREGMVGLGVFLESEDIITQHIIVQIPDSALRISAQDFLRIIQQSPDMHSLLHRYVRVFIYQISQAIVCERLHSIQQRFAQWLLMTSDRTGSGHFFLTQEFLAQIMGVRRASINNMARVLLRRGLTSYKRGWITILDRAGIEAMACDCYQNIRESYQRMAAPLALGTRESPGDAGERSSRGCSNFSERERR